MISRQLTERTERIKSGIANAAEEVIRGPKTIRRAEYFVRLVLGFMLSLTRLFASYAPFGVAIVASSGAGMSGAVSLLGSLLGYILIGGVSWGFKYASTAVLVFAANFVFRNTPLVRKEWFIPLNAAFMTAVTSFPYAFDAGMNVRAISLFLMETVLCGGCSYFYKKALAPWSSRQRYKSNVQHMISVLILLVTFIAALSNVTIMAGISLGRLAACMAVMLVAYKAGATTGCAVGVAVGMVMDASVSGGAFFSMAYASAGLISGLLARRGKLIFALSFVIANAGAVLWAGSGIFSIPSLYEVFCASVVFMILPASLTTGISSAFAVNVRYAGGGGALAYTRSRVEKLSSAFMGLHDSVRLTKERESEKDTATIFDRAAEQCCGNCPLNKSCWERDSESTYSAITIAAPKMFERSKLLQEDFPAVFRNKCLDLKSLVEAANTELRSMLYRRQYNNRLRENRSSAKKQYSDVAEILSNVACELQSERNTETQIENKLYKYLRSQSVDADIEIFRNKGGRLCIEIQGNDLSNITRDKNCLDKLSAAVGLRLCEKHPLPGETGRRMHLMEAEPLAASVGIAAVRKKGESVSGDRGTYFKTDEGVLYVILSDGMGSGENAAKESAVAITILERFLKAGTPVDMALELLNSSMLLNNIDEPTCTTIDLMSLNLFSGETVLCKYGASPTYIRKDRTVKRICSDSLAAGVFSGMIGAPDVIRMTLEPDSIAVIVSDGVVVESDDLWIRELLVNFEGNNCRELSRLVLEEGMKRRGCDDDMTVLTVSMENRT